MISMNLLKNLFKMFTVIIFFVLCLCIYISLSDESSFYYFLHLALLSFIFASSLFYDKKHLNSHNWNNKTKHLTIAGIFISVFWFLFLIYIKRSDLLIENAPYSKERFIYVLSVCGVSFLIGYITNFFIAKSLNPKENKDN
mgnify:FL=1